MIQKNPGRDSALQFRLLVGAIVLFAIAWGWLPWVLGSSWFDGEKTLERRLAMLGAFGDMFGFLNAIFSGVAFAAIYYTLRIQQNQHDIQEAELNMKKQIAHIIVDESESSEIFQTLVPGNGGPECPASYVRLVLKNEASMPAKGCRVMLTGIEKKKHGEQFAIIPESKQTLRLLHSTETDDAPEETVFTIPHNLPQYFKVCSIKRDPPDGHPCGLLQLAHRDSKYRGLAKHFELGCDYRFHISVDSENSTPLAVQMVISVGDGLDRLQVDKIEVKEKPGRVFYTQ